MKMTVDKFVTMTKKSCLTYIIETDNLEMCRICICNMSGNCSNDNRKLCKYRYPNLTGLNSILFGVITFDAIKIARDLLAPVHKQNGNKYCKYNYNFPNIDILTPDSSSTKQTPLTFAALCQLA